MSPAVRYPDIRLSVVIPAYNEEGNIAQTIPRAVAALRRMVGAFEIILIDDKSTDRTLEMAQELAAVHAEITLIANEHNLRQGGCLRKGFALAKYEYVTHNAMDYAFDFDDLPLLLEHFPRADVVVGGRRTYPGISAARGFVSWTNRAIISLLFGANVKDYNFIQIYKRSVLETQRSFSTATSFITPEKIIRAHVEGLYVVEVDVEYHRRVVGVGSSANLRNVTRALREMGRLWWELRGKR
jgi:glycosyltransferase involved in cell wall biosynthesis